MYTTIYDLINEYIFNNSIQSGTYEELCAKLLATAGSVLIFSVPFIIVKKIVRSITD